MNVEFNVLLKVACGKMIHLLIELYKKHENCQFFKINLLIYIWIFSSSYNASEDADSDEEPKVNEEEFFFAVAESTSKITIHSIR